MRFLYKSIITALSAALLIMGCGKAGTDHKLRVAVSIYPLYDLTRQLTGPEVDLFCLLPPGANPHTFTPRPSDMARLEHVDLFIAVSPDFDGWAADHLPQSTKRLFLAAPDGHTDDAAHGHAQDHAHEHHGDNPHIWLSLHRAAVLSRDIAKGITAAGGTIDTLGQQRFLARLDTLHRHFKTLFSAIDNKSFFQWHPAWNQFAEDYGLHIAGTLEQGHGDSPSVRAMAELIHIAESDHIKTIVLGLNVESPAALALARETGGTLLHLDTMGRPDVPEHDSYLKLMTDNAERLARALSTQ